MDDHKATLSSAEKEENCKNQEPTNQKKKNEVISLEGNLHLLKKEDSANLGDLDKLMDEHLLKRLSITDVSKEEMKEGCRIIEENREFRRRLVKSGHRVKPVSDFATWTYVSLAVVIPCSLVFMVLRRF